MRRATAMALIVALLLQASVCARATGTDVDEDAELGAFSCSTAPLRQTRILLFQNGRHCYATQTKRLPTLSVTQTKAPCNSRNRRYVSDHKFVC
jgi:hypothetical protein